MSHAPFSSLALQPALLENLASLGYTAMTPIQARSLPPMLAGRDVIGQGRTGSGKTAAFGLGLLNRLEPSRFRVQTLVLCPTRELADQVAREIRRLARAIANIKVLTLCGGLPIGPQIGSLEHGAHVVVGTPGRIEDHLRKRTLDLSQVGTLVLDEADRMLEMGFQEALDAIVGQLPTRRQTLLFSATFPESIQAMAGQLMDDPEHIHIQGGHDHGSIRQHFFRLQDNKQRLVAVRLLLLQQRPESTVVFCNTKRESQEVADELCAQGFTALALHGDLDQKQRDETLVRFANKSASVLVATDVAARGLDIDALDAVINYHIGRDSDVHTHRIGRTGRAGSKGAAYTLYTGKEEHKAVRLEADLDLSIEPEVLPPFRLLEHPAEPPAMVTLQIDGGRKAKVRPGDILGALTGEHGIAGKQVGKIDLFDHCAYVAVERNAAKPALRKLRDGKLKGRRFRVRRL
ncbi:ATP-dependent RNA helicase DbpA [Tamilnaduibacter salinus]|uniref:ATP-dependent RNA helicase DbpA n=1 Tax=Tamilnaduibacter salinus TaxID=1484056 RepID=A0A2A2I6V3_9GAMM|nr:ATP-dependent RNA helicase DbpA [Tamilnaduibacter salinus]PAV27108.1 ATP-dependent RNA helicase DbpA [Tamilnaduibacter salinus]